MYYTQGGRGLTDRQTEYKVERIKRVSSPVLVFYYKEIYATTGRMLLLLLCKVRTWLELSKTSSVSPSLPPSLRTHHAVCCMYTVRTYNQLPITRLCTAQTVNCAARQGEEESPPSVRECVVGGGESDE